MSTDSKQAKLGGKAAEPVTVGTNFWVNIVLLIGSVFGGMSGDTATIIVSSILGVVAAAFAARNWFVKAHFSLDKSWVGDPNNWAYIGTIVGALIPAAGSLVPALKDLATALVAGNWPAIITAGLTMLSLLYYLVIKKKSAPAAA